MKNNKMRTRFSEKDRNRKNSLKQSRILKGYTQKEVAEYSLVPLRTYQAYEQDVRRPSIDSAIRVSRVLGVLPQDLWDIPDERIPTRKQKYWLDYWESHAERYFNMYKNR